MAININDGTRPDRLTLDRRVTGELEGEVPRAHRDALAVAKAQVAPFDYEILRSASHRLVTEPIATPAAPEPTPYWWSMLMPVLAAAAAMLLMVQIGMTDAPLPSEVSRSCSDASLDTFLMRGGVGQTWTPGTVLTEGDFVQFAYSTDGLCDTLVLLSIDSEGTLAVLWPTKGDIPMSVPPDGTGRLEGSIALNSTRGPDTFVALFGTATVPEATRLAEDVYETGGVSGLSRLASQDPAIDVVVIDKE